MGIILELVSEKNADDIYKFEIENRAYFEQMLPSRGAGYYNRDVFDEIIREIIVEQQREECHMYIIRDEFGNMVGRVNLFSIGADGNGTAELGYRIGKDEKGKGYGTEAVRMILEKGFGQLKLNKVSAGTSPDNIGSQRVLEKNGFIMAKRVEKDRKVNGNLVDSLIYEKYSGRSDGRKGDVFDQQSI